MCKQGSELLAIRKLQKLWCQSSTQVSSTPGVHVITTPVVLQAHTRTLSSITRNSNELQMCDVADLVLSRQVVQSPCSSTCCTDAHEYQARVLNVRDASLEKLTHKVSRYACTSKPIN